MATIGWGVIDQAGPQRFVVKAYGCILTPAGRPFADRLQQLGRELRELVDRYKPDSSAVEDLFISKSSRSAASVGHGRGVILFVLKELALPVYEYNPRTVKIAMTGFGAAVKFILLDRTWGVKLRKQARRRGPARAR